jgi:hypothetical protein
VVRHCRCFTDRRERKGKERVGAVEAYADADESYRLALAFL